jgi:glyoxylase-like metal-dependent hydrolase (beta-lactamase superfamily II)
VRYTRITSPSDRPSTGGAVHAYLVHGAVPTLIDAPSADDAFLDQVGETLAAAGDGPLQQVIATHAHPDHVAGAGGLAARWPAARFLKQPSPGGDEPPSGVSWEPVHGEPVLPAGDEQLWVLQTPGHAPDHICLMDVRSATVFAGDLVMNGGTVSIPASAGGCLADYLRSLRKVLELQPRRMLPGHGDPIDQPTSLLRGYISHRLQRERQVMELLAAGVNDQHGLVQRLYPWLEPDLLPAAQDTVLAHLQKLEQDGAAACDDGRWALRR